MEQGQFVSFCQLYFDYMSDDHFLQLLEGYLEASLVTEHKVRSSISTHFSSLFLTLRFASLVAGEDPRDNFQRPRAPLLPRHPYELLYGA